MKETVNTSTFYKPNSKFVFLSIVKIGKTECLHADILFTEISINATKSYSNIGDWKGNETIKNHFQYS